MQKPEFSSLMLLMSTLVFSNQIFSDVAAPPTEIAVNTQTTTRADSIPDDVLDATNDGYLEGYVQALVDMHFYEYRVIVIVKDKTVYLSHLPKNELMANSIVSFVKDLPQVRDVEVKNEASPHEVAIKQAFVEKPHVDGVWFPQSTVLFAPLIADPRDPTNSAAYRFGDKVIGQNVVAVSIGDDFPIFRWRDVFRWRGDMQIGIEGAIWAVFNYSDLPPSKSNDFSELVNTDYYVGIPLTYAFDRWSFRLRAYHISSHLGDEFICNHPEYVTERVNPSYEAVDFFTSFQFSSKLRGYFGPGVIVHWDPTFKLKPLYVQYGFELRLFGKKLPYHGIYGTPFLAVHLDNYQFHHWTLDSTFCLGYELSKLQGIGRKARMFIEYHQGFSWEGQFMKDRTKYGEIGFSWGF